MTRSLTLAALALALVPAAHAQVATPAQNQNQDPERNTTTTTTQVQNGRQVFTANEGGVSDALFAQAAAIGGLAEVSLSQLGAQKATDPQLKEFSRKMIEEHTRMNAQLTELAAQKRMPLPRAIDPRAQFCAQSLAGLSGEEFDRCYAKAQLLVHMDAVATFEAESKRGQDPEIKALASQALPRIKEHLKMVKPIAKKYMEQEESK